MDIERKLTQTELKLRDAGIQMQIALKASDDQVFRSCINSFISLSRSVTFVMQKESSYNPELIAWYENRMDKLKKLAIMKFFQDKRTFTIHKGHIEPTSHTVPIISVTINGVKVSASGAQIKYWVFDDIKEYLPDHSGNVLLLCEEYFIILKRLVRDWIVQKSIWDNPNWLNTKNFMKNILDANTDIE